MKLTIRGISLIEVVIFIVILGIVGAAILSALGVALEYSPTANYTSQATQYAQARMDLILGQKAAHGFSNFSDPCDSTPSLPVCSSSGYTESFPI